jgi:hypothetical protein
MKARGVLLSTEGPLHTVIKMKPPLVFDDGDAGRLVEGLDAVLEEIRDQRPEARGQRPEQQTVRGRGN